jgi:hypothetical protein
MLPERMSSFCLDDAMKIYEEEFSIITREEWRSRCNNALHCEQNYLRLEPIIDISEQIILKTLKKCHLFNIGL